MELCKKSPNIKIENESTSICLNDEHSLLNESSVTLTLYSDDRIQAEYVSSKHNDEITQYNVRVLSKGCAFEDRLTLNDNVLKLLIRAVNNRTRERNYFKLYSELLEEEISEDFFEKKIKENEDDYIITENIVPDYNTLQEALVLSSKIKNVETTDDFTSVFSFAYERIHALLKEIKDGKICE